MSPRVSLAAGMSDDSIRHESQFYGARAFPGVARGLVHVVKDDFDAVALYRISSSQIADEIGRFEAALVQTRMMIEMQQRIANPSGRRMPLFSTPTSL